MEIGISTGFLYNKSIYEVLPLIKDAGFTAIEVWASAPHDGKYIHFNWHEKHDIEELFNRSRDTGLKIHSLHAPFSDTLNIAAIDENMRKNAVSETIRAMEALKNLGGSILTVHPASDEGQPHERGKGFAQSRRSLEEIAAFAREMGLQIALENQLPHILGGDVPTLLSLIEGFPRDLAGICFDTSHANLIHSQSVDNTFRQVAELVKALHISDNTGRHDDHSAPGEGIINWPPFIHALRQANYNGVFMLEVIPPQSQTPNYGEMLKIIYTKIDLLINEEKK